MTGADGDGVLAVNVAGDDILVNTTQGSVTASDIGINVLNQGSGDTSIVAGDIVAAAGAAIRSTSYGTTATISAFRAISGARGIEAVHYGTGELAIRADAVTGTTAEGILAYNAGSGLTIDTVGGVTGATAGITAFNGGTGALSVTTGDVTGTAGYGIYAYGIGTDLTIDSSAGSVSGEIGIVASNFGTGATTITTGNVTGTSAYGIYAYGAATDLTIDTAAGAVSGATVGIYASSGGSGALSITTADVAGAGELGIGAVNSAAGTDLSIDSSAGTVTSALVGIGARSYGTGALSITTADVTAIGGTGVYGYQSANGTSFAIDASAGTVSGGSHGIYAEHFGSGPLTITTGDVTGGSAFGIFARSAQATADITIQGSSGDIVGATDGIQAITAGADILVTDFDSVTGQAGDGLDLESAGGAIAVSDIGTILGTGGTGIIAVSDGGAISIQGVGLVGGVTGTGGDGIVAYALGGGDIAIGTSAAIGDVTGDGTAFASGILAITDGAGTIAVDTTGGSVSGTQFGVLAESSGAGSVTITTADVSSATYDGVFARSLGGGTVTVDTSAGTVTADRIGVRARVDAAGGDVFITTADVNSATGDGVLGESIGGGSITIDTVAGSVSGGRYGMIAGHYGTGGVTITTADVTGVTDGIDVRTDTGTTGVAIDSTAGTVTGGGDGISVRSNAGTGAVSITAADVSAGSIGILAENTATATDIIIDSAAGAISSGSTGISAENGGTGNTSITTADVTSTGDNAISASNAATADSLAIDTTAGSVTGATDGIAALNDGTGSTTITTADIDAEGRYGVYAINAASTTDLTIDTSAGDVTAALVGIAVRNEGTGALSITGGDVTSAGGTGVYGNLTAAGTDLAIDTSAGAIGGATNGIYAENYGSGATAITTADVTAGSGFGVFVRNAATGTSLDVTTTAGAVSGGVSGITVRSDGAGATTITTADVTGTAGPGIDASGVGTSLAIDTTAGAVSGATTGILASVSAGTLTIATADVTGTSGNAISVITTGADAAIDTSAGAIVGGANGIYAAADGTGSLTVTAADATGLAGSGISVRGGADSTGISIATSGDVTGTEPGIYAVNNGTAPTVIVNDGFVSADTREAIRARGPAGSQITNNGELVGFVTLDDAADTLTNNGEFLAIGHSAFGGGTDSLVNTGTFRVASAGPVNITGLETFANEGLIDMADGTSGNNLATSGNFVGTGGSTLNVDVDLAAATADTLTIEGAATGSTVVTVNPAGTQPSGLVSDILVVDAGAGTTANAFDLVGGRQTIGLIEFDLAFDPAGNDFFLATAPSTAALEFSTFAETARNLWTQSANAFADQMATMRDTGGSDESSVGGGDKTTRAWLTGFGSSLEREQVRNTVFNNIAGTHELGYDQDFWGMLAGIDFGTSAVRYGVTAGYQSSDVEFTASSNGIDYDVFSLGAYMTADIGAFWANALAKYDSVNGTLQSNTAGLTADVEGSVMGVQAEAGALLGDRRAFFLEPSVSFAYASSDLDDIVTAQGTFAFDAGDGALARGGARAGIGFDLGGTSGVVFVGAHYAHELGGDDTAVSFATGPNRVLFGNQPFDDYVDLSAGITIGNEDDAITGSLQGNYLTGDDLDGYGGSLNVRFRF
ncbi:autotransporter outer membrane beta-barrel domain-containing protein [Erythrobacter sp. HL-111]|uniref:beta strand repeat-containing protein n=1 Tax=Erythrobacter sp. HL-111 TaxID=1798193 RepID=UPI0006DAAA2B|nr:autotransporter outer membrane beta-barrel domain-containing protein [Erythrobacter sp. HL-111]KPP94422.1 MAG: Pertactin [Erythrobacteraceae bacterium HL-111]SDS55963.1 outer membrane autotransporter barrel domain-containing protein [Erythrobacter sp. HL-111]